MSSRASRVREGGSRAWVARAGALTLLGALIGTASGCARQAGALAAQGAVEQLQKKSAEGKGQGPKPVEDLPARAAEAVVDRLSEPEQMEKIRRMAAAAVTQAAAAAVASALDRAMHKGGRGGSLLEAAAVQTADGFRRQATSGLIGDLGKQGDGPLGTALANAAGRASASALGGVLATLAPECDPWDRRCIDVRVREVGSNAAAGFSTGLKQTLGLPALALAFLGGAVCAAAVALAVATLRSHRQRAVADERAGGPPPSAPAEQPT